MKIKDGSRVEKDDDRPFLNEKYWRKRKRKKSKKKDVIVMKKTNNIYTRPVRCDVSSK